MNMSSVLISGGIAATLVYYGRRWLRAAETRADHGFRDVVIEAAAEWMSQHEGGGDRDGHAHPAHQGRSLRPQSPLSPAGSCESTTLSRRSPRTRSC
jgi:hypothetical protein